MKQIQQAPKEGHGRRPRAMRANGTAAGKFCNLNAERRGIVAPLVGATAIVLVGMTALAIDLGYVFLSNNQMQAAVDAAALAGVTAAPQNNYLAVWRAQGTGTKNVVAKEPLVANELNVQVGYWHNAAFSLPTGEEWAVPNAVRVVGTRPGISMFFARAVGYLTTNVEREATAAYGSGTCAGIWGLQGVVAGGNLTTDSYYSSAGPYGAGNIYYDGDICSGQDIDVMGSPIIGGDAMYGEGYDITFHGGAYELYGVAAEHGNDLEVPDINMAAAAANNDNAAIGLTDNGHDPFKGTEWDVTLNANDNLTINGGTFYLTSAKLSGQATLTITAPTTLYISGSAAFGGGGVTNVTANPKNLVIYSTGAKLDIRGNAAFHGVVVAPETEVTFIGESEIYGAVVSETLKLQGDSQIHVDSSSVLDILSIGPRAPVLVE